MIAAAGDIACDPDSASFNDGRGGPDNCRQMATSDLLLGIKPTAILTLGDNQYDEASFAQFLRAFEPSWGRFKRRIFPVVGNHEYLTPRAAGFCRYFGAVAHCDHGSYYSFDLGSWHIVALNSQCPYVGGCGRGSPQETWLRADLAAHHNLCTLAYWHEPRWTSSRYGNAGQMAAIWSDVVAARADVVLSAHNHLYERFVPLDAAGRPARAGVREFVVGTGGSSHYDLREPPRPGERARNARTFGVLKLTLRGGRYDWRFVPVGSGFADSGSSRCR